jgi:hypothetical protein
MGNAADGSVSTRSQPSVWVGTEGAAYAGIAFRVADAANYELAYAVPHASGQWDAIQYDPVFHASNTWQLYHGPAYQAAMTVPTGRWFRLEVTYCGQRAAIAVDGQPPLVVQRLAHATGPGWLGLWTFRPTYFAELRVATVSALDVPQGPAPLAVPATVEAWFAEGYGVVACEPSGVLNLNRYLPAATGEVRLLRRFEAREGGEVAISFGYSDALTLELDGREIYAGERTFTGFADRSSRGYAELGDVSLRQNVGPGTHDLAAVLRVCEGFGWGMVLSAQGAGLQWLPTAPG